MERANRKIRIGYVTSDQMDKTVVVSIVELVRHPLYGKAVKRTIMFKAHDEETTCRTKKNKKIMETRPLSKDKRWRVVEVIERAAE